MKLKLTSAQAQALDAMRARAPGWSDEHLLAAAFSGIQATQAHEQHDLHVAAEVAASAKALREYEQRNAQPTIDELRAEVAASEQRLREMGITLDAPAHVPAQEPLHRSGTRSRLVKPRTHAEGLALLAARNLWLRTGAERSGADYERVMQLVRSMVPA
jgi:hypothetical protein